MCVVRSAAQFLPGEFKHELLNRHMKLNGLLNAYLATVMKLDPSSSRAQSKTASERKVPMSYQILPKKIAPKDLSVALGNLAEEITRARRESTEYRETLSWNPIEVQKLEQYRLLNFIEVELSKIAPASESDNARRGLRYIASQVKRKRAANDEYQATVYSNLDKTNVAEQERLLNWIEAKLCKVLHGAAEQP